MQAEVMMVASRSGDGDEARRGAAPVRAAKRRSVTVDVDVGVGAPCVGWGLFGVAGREVSGC